AESRSGTSGARAGLGRPRTSSVAGRAGEGVLRGCVHDPGGRGASPGSCGSGYPGFPDALPPGDGVEPPDGRRLPTRHTCRFRTPPFDVQGETEPESNDGESMKAEILTLPALVLATMPPSLRAQEPITGYAPVNGLQMYYELHGAGTGVPLVLLHGSLMTIPGNWDGWLGELAKTRPVIAVELQGHGRTADVERDFSYENLADDVVGLLDHLEVPRADLLGYSMGGGVAIQTAIRHAERVRRVVSISAVFRHDGWVDEALQAFPNITGEVLSGSPIESGYLRLSPTPEHFAEFVERVIAMDLVPYDFGAERLRATEAPIFFIHGDADGVRLEHI